MKKNGWLTILAALILALGIIGTVHAEIIPPHGEGQIGFQAVVLCDELTLRRDASASAKAVTTLPYGYLIIVTQQKDGWARCVLSDSEDEDTSGWVRADYIAVDPAWYRTEAETPVYAWNDAAAPKVALLGRNTTLPILKQEGDWLVVSLRGAVGWIRKGASD